MNDDIFKQLDDAVRSIGTLGATKDVDIMFLDDLLMDMSLMAHGHLPHRALWSKYRVDTFEEVRKRLIARLNIDERI